MAIRFNCTKCSHLLQVPDTTAGRKAKCPNCGHVLPVPGGPKSPGQAASAKAPGPKPAAPKPSMPKPSGAKPAKPGAAPEPVGMEPLAGAAGAAGPAGPGPIPTFTGKKKKSKKKAAVPGGAKEGPPELRSGKRAVIIGAVLVVVLAGAVVAWKMGVFGGKEPAKPPPKKRVTTRTRTVTPRTEQMTAEQIKAATDQMETKLASLAERLELESAGAELDASVIGHLRELEKYSGVMPARTLSTTDLGVRIDENKAWLYENVLARAESLVGEYRFKTAKELLDKALAGEVKAAKEEDTSRRRGTSRVRTTRQVAKGTAAEQACRELAAGELIKHGLSGEVSLWTREQVDDLGNTTVIVSLDNPEETKAIRTRRPTAGRSQPRTSGTWEQTWGPVSSHLGYIRDLQAGAERGGQMARAGELYNMARELESRCISFETPGADDAELLNQLARERADRKVHEQIRGLIGRCRYEEALPLAKRLVAENPRNPDNHFWVLRCYLESYNGKALAIELNELRRIAAGAAELNKYDLGNNLLAVGLGMEDQPSELAIAEYRQWRRRRGRRLDELSAYAGENKPIVEWLRGESSLAALEDFQYRRFLSGESIDLLDSKGVIYTVYSSGGPVGQAALVLARIGEGPEEQGLYVQMEDGYRYRLWNVYPPAIGRTVTGTGTRIPSKPTSGPVKVVEDIRAVDLSGNRTIPLLTSLRVLRCEQEGSGWTLLIPRAAVHREQREEEKPRTTRSSTTDRRTSTPTRSGAASLPGAGDRTGSTTRTSRTRSSREPEQNGQVRISFPGSRSRTRTSRGGESEAITCLVRGEQVEMAYFSDSQGKYLIGPAGRRFYVTEGGYLSSGGDSGGGQWCMALSGSKCPERLRRDLRDYVDDWDSEERPGDSPLSVSEAAIWLGSVAEGTSGTRRSTSSRSTGGAVFGRTSGGSRRSSTAGEAPIVSRWVDSGGRIVALVDGQIVEVAASGMIRSMFYSTQDAMDLLGEARERYQASLADWPTVGGEAYNWINSERVSELIGQNVQRRSSRSVRGSRTGGTDLTSELARAGRYMAAGDFNQVLAICGDITGALSVRLQRATENDSLSAPGAVRTTSSTRGVSTPSVSGVSPFLSDAQSRARQAVGAGTRLPRASRRGASQPSLAADEEYFVNAAMLVQAQALRAMAYQKGGMPDLAEQSVSQGAYRVKGYLQGELIEWIRELQSQGAAVSPHLVRIRQQWQGMGEAGFQEALKRSLQAAEGKGKTTGGWGSWLKKSAGGGGSSMSLSSWLAGESKGAGGLSGEGLFAARQFEWVRMSMSAEDSDEAEQVDSAERAKQIIELLRAYKVSSRPKAEVAEALWELGSYMSAVGHVEEAEHCLGQAGAVYSDLAQSLLPSGSRLASQPRHILQKYYTYRVAGLSALAQGAASGEESAWPDGRGLMLAEIEGKLAQIARRWSDTSEGTDGLVKMLHLADHAMIAVGDMNKSGGLYEYPRVRFWWWYYPALEADERVAAGEGGIGDRPKLEYIERAPSRPGGDRNRRGRETQPVMPAMPLPGELPMPQ